MTIYTKSDLTDRLYDAITQEIDYIVNDETTTAAMYGYYHAHKALLANAIDSSSNRTEARSKLIAVESTYKEMEADEIDSVPLYLLRDYLEDYVRSRILPHEESPAYEIIVDCIEMYDWCGYASRMEDSFGKLI